MNTYEQKMYNTWKNLNELKWQRLHRIEDSWKQFLLDHTRKLFPKRKIKDVFKAFDVILEKMGAEYINKLKGPYQAMVELTKMRYEKFEGELETHLKEISKDIVVVPSLEFHKVNSCETSRYHTQGWGAEKYAEASLQDDKFLLEILGFSTEIRRVNVGKENGWDFDSWEYQLWANITPEDFQVLKWQGQFISVLNWAVLCWRKNVNPKVYFPFLSDKDYERSQVLARDHNYVITKDNMKLEIYE